MQCRHNFQFFYTRALFSRIKILCDMTDYWSKCRFRHLASNRSCSFDYSKSEDKEVMRECDEGIKERISFSGNYYDYQCGMVLVSVSKKKKNAYIHLHLRRRDSRRRRPATGNAP